MNQKNQDTKEKIIDAARNLFAENGYEGTSVRDIANDAGVNLAAVNYHFRNKHTLYWEIFVRGYKWLDESIAKVGEKCSNTEELVWQIFRHLMSESKYVSTTYRTILSQSVPDPEGEHKSYTEEIRVGPPGAMTIAKMIIKEVEDPDPAGVMWAVSSIFSSMFHWVLMFNASYFRRMKQDIDLTEQKMEKHLTLHTRAILDYLKSHKGDFPEVQALICDSFEAAVTGLTQEEK